MHPAADRHNERDGGSFSRYTDRQLCADPLSRLPLPLRAPTSVPCSVAFRQPHPPLVSDQEADPPPRVSRLRIHLLAIAAPPFPLPSVPTGDRRMSQIRSQVLPPLSSLTAPLSPPLSLQTALLCLTAGLPGIFTREPSLRLGDPSPPPDFRNSLFFLGTSSGGGLYGVPQEKKGGSSIFQPRSNKRISV